MAMPSSRTAFKEFCLRQLGKPVINIDVANSQVDDCVDMALSYYMDYHYDGSEKVYYKYQITAQDKVNGYITLPENIIGAVRIFDIGSGLNGGDMFNIQYQIMLNEVWSMTGVSLVPYYMARTSIEFMHQMLVGLQPIRYQRHTNKLHIDASWDRFEEGSYIIVEAFQVIDAEEYEDVWKDRWLIEYATQLIKQVWGNNTKKFGNMQLTGGIVFNGQQTYEEATFRIQQLRDEMMNSYSRPVQDMIG